MSTADSGTYQFPSQVIMVDGMDQYQTINLPGLVPNYTNVSNMTFNGQYHVRNYRFPARYYNIYPGDSYQISVTFKTESRDDVSVIDDDNPQNDGNITTGVLTLWTATEYMQVTPVELSQILDNAVDALMSQPLNGEEHSVWWTVQNLSSALATLQQAAAVYIASPETEANYGAYQLSVNEYDRYELTDQQLALFTFSRFCRIKYSKETNKIYVEFSTQTACVLYKKPSVVLSGPDDGPSDAATVELNPQYITEIDVSIIVPDTLPSSTQQFLKRAVGIPSNLSYCSIVLPRSEIDRINYQLQSAADPQPGYELKSSSPFFPVYTTLMCDLRRHRQIQISTGMQSNLWDLSGRKALLRVLPFAGDLNAYQPTTHIETSDSFTFIEVTDLRHATLTITDENGMKIFFIEPYHIEIGIQFSSVRSS